MKLQFRSPGRSIHSSAMFCATCHCEVTANASMSRKDLVKVSLFEKQLQGTTADPCSKCPCRALEMADTSQAIDLWSIKFNVQPIRAKERNRVQSKLNLASSILAE